MKYTLNDGYNGEILVSQCGKIFKKGIPIELGTDFSFEIEQYIGQRFVIPYNEEVAELKKEIKAKEEQISKTNSEYNIPKPKGVSTVETKEETLKPVEQELDI